MTLEQLRAEPGGVRVPLQTRHAKHAEPDANGKPRGFATPSRKVELWSETFLEHGYPPLPDFVEPPIGPVARPDLAARFPLVLTCAKPTLFCQTQHRALPSLRKRAPHPGGRAASRRRRRRAASPTATGWRSRRRRAACGPGPGSTTNLDPRVVVGEHGWWQACAELGAPGYDPFGPSGANFNLLIAARRSIRSAARPRTAPICARSGRSPEHAAHTGLSNARAARRSYRSP